MLNINLIEAFNLDENFCEELNNWQNITYKAKTKTNEFVAIRVTPISHRSKKEIESEIKIIQEVSKINSCVPTLICVKDAFKEDNLSFSDRYIVSYRDKSHKEEIFYAVCFKWINNSLLIDKLQTKQTKKYVSGKIIIDLFYEIGKSTALIHKAMDNINVTEISRMSWNEEPLFLNINKFKNEMGEKLYSKIICLFENLKNIKRNDLSVKNDYGLIHNDLRFHNIFEGEKLIIIDFDQVCFNYRIKDLANLLFATFIHPRICIKCNYIEISKDCIKFFKQGYNKYRIFPEEQLSRLNIFIKERAILAYLCELEFGFKEKNEKHKKEIIKSAGILKEIILSESDIF